jgi:hypothetical protein
VSGRQNFRKGGAADAFWERLRERVNMELPLGGPPKRFTIYDFVIIEANETIASFNVHCNDWRLTIGRCLWRYRPDRTDFIELPPHIGMSDPFERARFLAEIRAAVWAYAFDRFQKQE